MMIDLTWNEFCELYYETAKRYADDQLERLRKKLGGINRRVDEDYVKDAAIVSALEKAYSGFDESRRTKITTFLFTIIHNEIVDGVKRELKAAAIQQDIDDIKSAIKYIADDSSSEARAHLIPLLREAIARLSPSDQVILNYYLEDKASYIEESVKTLHISPTYVSVRRNRIFKLLPKLMEMTRGEYIQYCIQYESGILAGEASGKGLRILRPNPILPMLDITRIADNLLPIILVDE